MQQHRGSRSAAIVAAHRAMESLKPEHERICYDPYAEKLLPPSFTVIGESSLDKHQALELFRQHVPGFHEYFLVRTRYFDEMTIEAIENGITQLVILGAGYDTRALRLEGVTGGDVHVFEVDLPATQQAKVDKLTSFMERLPDCLTFIPHDLRRGGLNEQLQKEGVHFNEKTLFILEGVSMYLSREEVEGLLHLCSEHCVPGSSIIFDFTFPEVIDGCSDHPVAQIWQGKAAEGGEPLTFGIESSELHNLLTRKGYTEVKIVDHHYLTNTYLAARNDKRKASPLLAIASAVR